MVRTYFLCSGCLLLAVTACAAGTGWSLNQVPDFYRAALDERPDPIQRQKQARHFEQRTMRLVEEMQYSRSWSQEFSEEQVNSWLAEELPQRFDAWIPPGVSEPRVHFTSGAIHLAFRYRDSYWNTVISAELKPKVTAQNRLSIEFVRAHAGGFPVPMHDVLIELSRMLEAADWPHYWVEQNGNQVIVVELEHDGMHRPALESLQVEEGRLSVSGRRVLALEARLAELFMPRFDRPLIRRN